MNAEIVITGCGLVGAFGCSEASFATALQAGIPCVGECTYFSTRRQVAQVRGFKLTEHIKNPKAERSPRISQYALVAAAQAVRQSGIDNKVLGSESSAIVYGTGNGPAVSSERSLEAIIAKGLDAVEPLAFQESVFNAPASLISIQYGIKGPSVVLPNGHASGLYALKVGMDLLRLEYADRILVVAADELASTTMVALAQLGFITPNDKGTESAKPFHSTVNGASYGEGAAALLLERRDTAITRKARIRAKISACVVAGDDRGPGTPDPSGQALARALETVLTRAECTKESIGHVLAGTMVTRDSDQAELNALGTVFKDRTQALALTSIKPVIGETYGSASLMSVVAGILELEGAAMFVNPGPLGLAPPPIDLIQTSRPLPSNSAVLINAIGPSSAYACAVLESA
ncbi:hypothetical protein TI04_02815 [Achromatium sp. WMS2]|nr:hypothetical protein TI04_02815 [Achromatium sp. WMS2]